ncbi:hypothetical protein EHI8A_029620 [Entamoeba histolytica HM-1:IMSS-B]|uniref:Exocyst component Exo84 C-terminal domain-containing protein n=6 Tax=Entamoeba histolytica TaxID=5759 RepID=C4M9V3_ENTH1|nr:hypothetical protein EHI_036860 [Entamoeba histolytica HM-1:IMSS]EMD44363.1 Hypothetical protein EHI5A_046530 [Entamoeba histolytica KU27]EMH75237.1 hypothetical protein EHI8A_029620 [Entamoeba histolytica HM-1:IMSS-B]EMS16488.1 hypothetical protein KM1_054170 [Entamoeba histolytica HM-3:IMSS]ENY63950.1 hypothetical protein EHI7A_032680 [Entamoeba histolytica HM-1:IMSS-A]GAT98503.1 hypothetical protein CL6EHI_036860 [Entamoeba histolytica]|eukprot:XP_649634.1 hypothetical protein EHI_036860 [Entamoeba histolytica HM-1:IMSS]
MAEELIQQLKENEKGYIDDIYKNHSHQQIENTTLQQLKGFLADKSDELKQAVYDNYQEFLAITRRLEEIEQDFMTIHTQFNAIGTELDELNQHYATEMREQQSKLDKLITERSSFLNISNSLNNENNDMTSKIPQLRNDIKYILDAPSLLQVYLSQWNFDECIKIHDNVRHLLNKNNDLKNVLKGHVALDQFEEMIDHIVDKLKKRLFDLSLSSRQTVVIINHLKKVTNEEKAMLIFLDARTKTAKERIERELHSENLSLVTQNVCSFAFPLIKSTHSVFVTSFPVAPTSCFASWNISLINFVMNSLEKKIANKEVKQNSIKVDCVDKIITLYDIVPQELSLVFIVRKYLSNIVRSLSKSKDEIDPKMIQKLTSHGFGFPF